MRQVERGLLQAAQNCLDQVRGGCSLPGQIHRHAAVVLCMLGWSKKIAGGAKSSTVTWPGAGAACASRHKWSGLITPLFRTTGEQISRSAVLNGRGLSTVLASLQRTGAKGLQSKCLTTSLATGYRADAA
eukprot:1157764-Pelagomonas_calceolata.AAC.9